MFELPNCQQAGTLFLEEKHDRQKGLASNLVIICECGYENDFYTLQTVNKCSLKQSMNPFAVNLRAVYGMRTIGADHASLEKLCVFFNMPKPMTVKNFTNISNSSHRAAKVVAQRSMSTSCEWTSCVQYETFTKLDIGVSVDGTWQRRGFTSLNGVLVVMSIDSGKIVGIEPMSRYCRECAIHTRRLQDKPEELANWKIHHKEHCKLTHDGTAPSMELEGAKRIFGRSIDKHNARYTGFYGDGDSKAYT